MVRGRGFRIVAVVLLVVAYLVVYKMVARMRDPALAIPTPAERMPFAVDFTLPDVEGKLVHLADLRGRPILINIWATWCHPCRAEMPSINDLYQEYHSRGLVILAIAMDTGGKPDVARFVQAHRLTFTVLLDPQNMLGARLQVPGIPTTYLLDKQGRITGFEMGARDWHTPRMRHLVEQLLAEEGGGTAP